uniref:Uncharacterized protein n=1 Tax=Anguilla anguilla TaxID=7936 RepID=A0A0E9VA48_ANGAN
MTENRGLNPKSGFWIISKRTVLDLSMKLILEFHFGKWFYVHSDWSVWTPT